MKLCPRREGWWLVPCWPVDLPRPPWRGAWTWPCWCRNLLPRSHRLPFSPVRANDMACAPWSYGGSLAPQALTSWLCHHFSRMDWPSVPVIDTQNIYQPRGLWYCCWATRTTGEHGAPGWQRAAGSQGLCGHSPAGQHGSAVGRTAPCRWVPSASSPGHLASHGLASLLSTGGE